MDKSQLRKTAKKKFGDILFGERPASVRLQKPGNKIEKNTEYENKIYNMIMDFIDNQQVDMKTFLGYLKDLKQYEHIYPQILKNTNSPLYRGTVVSNDLFKKIIPNLKYKKLNDNEVYANKKSYCYYCNVTYKPKSVIQHWTDYLDVTYLFTFSDSKSLNKSVIYKAVNDKNTIFNSEAMNLIGHFSNEHEVFRIGNRVDCELYTSPQEILSYYNQTKDKQALNVPDIENFKNRK